MVSKKYTPAKNYRTLKKTSVFTIVSACFYLLTGCVNDPNAKLPSSSYQGKWVEGDGDMETLALLDKAFESLQVSSEMASLPMLYKRDWDDFIEGHFGPN